MTLLLTEIYWSDSDSIVVHAADGRITRAGRPESKALKVLKVPRLRAGIGFFGLAEVGRQTMSQWLSGFVGRSTASTLAELAAALVGDLNRVIPAAHRRRAPSGFHLCGYNDAGQPEFWFVNNIDTMTSTGEYITGSGTYKTSEDFQSRDAEPIGFGSGIGRQTYRNGDIRAHELSFGPLDEMMHRFLLLPDFRAPTNESDLVAFVKFKLEVASFVYRRYSSSAIVGTPVHAFGVLPDGTFVDP